jgi:alginate O-acetyltransferase complex protein AlgI
MIFNTWTFAVFGVLVIATYWGLVPQRWKPHFIVLTGSIFYAYSVPAYLILVVLLGLLTYVIAKTMLRTQQVDHRKMLLISGIVIVTGVLLWFKYSKMLAITVDEVANRDIIPVPSIIVPLAISFFTFEFVHVLVDVYLGKIKSLDLLNFAVFTMFFPTLVAGPIKRYQSFAPQIRTIQEPPAAFFLLNFYRIAMGVAKKNLIADSMTVFTQPILTPQPLYGTLDYWVAIFAYAAKIYFDFSGYSDIAIGLAGMLGLEIPENFSRPYHTANISEFWRHWHMSLSTWIRDYIFIPLGGSRGAPVIVVFNLLVAMALAGLWHGANWTFVLWGLWHGMGLAAHRAWSALVVPRFAVLANPGKFVRSVSVATTFSYVCIGWLLFAAPSVGNAYHAFVGLF